MQKKIVMRMMMSRKLLSSWSGVSKERPVMRNAS